MCNIIESKSGRLSKYVAQLCLNRDYSDVTFCVEGELLHAHRLILASREYFRALLFGDYVESQQKEIQLTVQATPFKTLLKYIYTDDISLGEMKFDEIIEILRLAHMYDFIDLTTAIEYHLKREVSMETVCVVLKVSQQLSLKSLHEACLKFLDANASTFLEHDDFVALSQESLCGLLKRNTFAAPESQIFEAVKNWTKHNADQHEAIITLLRLPLMTVDYLLEVVSPSGLVPQDIVFNAIRARNHSDHCETLQTSNNVASDKKGAKVIVGIKPNELLNDNTTVFDRTTGFTYHKLTTDKNKGITVDLGSTYFINHIRLLIWDKIKSYAHKYFVEISIDQINWDHVVDHSQYFCRSWQHLYFPLREVRYIQYFGIESLPKSDAIALVSLEAFKIPDIPCIYNGFVKPTRNVATNDHGTIVLTDIENSQRLLCSGSMMNFADVVESFEYTSHPFNDGEIVIQLGQPYYIESMRLLPWDPQNRTYRFYVQTSVDNINWTMAVDKRDKDMKSSSEDVFKFSLRLILYVKIIGTECSVKEDEEFRCVRFECPANPVIGSAAIKRKFVDESKRQNDLQPVLPLQH